MFKPHYYANVSLPEVERFAGRIFDLDGYQRGGATFAYPAALMPIEWLGVKTLANARNDYETELSKEKPKREGQTYSKSDWEQDVIRDLKERKRNGNE